MIKIICDKCLIDLDGKIRYSPLGFIIKIHFCEPCFEYFNECVFPDDGLRKFWNTPTPEREKHD